ncbi:MAG TPA: SPOR domain-containing protein [Thermoanaerobaculia bacterium]
MTGLAGRDDAAAEGPGQATAAASGAETETVPVPVRGVEPGAAARPAAEPTAVAAPAGEPETIQAFEDRPADAPAPTAGRSAPAPAPTAASAAGIRDGFWVQVYSLSNAAEARQKSVRLASRGYSSRVSESSGKGGTLWRVRVGPYATRDQADAAATKLRREEKTETWIVPQGQ